MHRVALVAAIVLLAGCANGSPPAELDCGDQVEHPFEGRCFTERAAPNNEVCTAWLGDGVTRSQSIYCEIRTDGHAHAHVDFTGRGSVTVYVRNEAGEKLVARTMGPGEQTIKVDDEPGRWRLVADFSDAVGPVRIQLWG